VIATFDTGNSHDDMEVNEEQHPQEFDAAHARLAQLYKAAHHSNASLSTSNLTHLHEVSTGTGDQIRRWRTSKKI
jgi:hypothetical protein